MDPPPLAGVVSLRQCVVGCGGGKAKGVAMTDSGLGSQGVNIVTLFEVLLC